MKPYTDEDYDALWDQLVETTWYDALWDQLLEAERRRQPWIHHQRHREQSEALERQLTRLEARLGITPAARRS